MAFNEKLAAMKAKQEAADSKKREEAEKAKAEAAKTESETKKSELQSEREGVSAEMAQAEQSALEAESAIKEAETFASEQGENLDPEAKAEIDGIKAEAAETIAKFEVLKAELARIDSEIAALEAGVTETVSTEEISSAQTEVETITKSTETEIVPELSPEEIFDKTSEVYDELQNSIEEKIKNLEVRELTREQLETVVNELKSDRLALLKGFNSLAEKLPPRKDKKKYVTISEAGGALFNNVDHNSLFNKVNKVIDDLARKINGSEIQPHRDYIITQRGWQEQTLFDDAEFEEQMKLTYEEIKDEEARHSGDIHAASIYVLKQMRPERLSETALKRFKEIAQKIIGEVPSKLRGTERERDLGMGTQMDKDIRNIEAGIRIVDRDRERDKEQAKQNLT